MVPALLHGRVFRRYWSASAISMFGDQVSGVALPLAAVLALHAGAAQMGYLTALEWLLGSVVGLRPALWVATIGGVAGFALLLPTPLPRYRLPAVDGPARA